MFIFNSGIISGWKSLPLFMIQLWSQINQVGSYKSYPELVKLCAFNPMHFIHNTLSDLLQPLNCFVNTYVCFLSCSSSFSLVIHVFPVWLCGFVSRFRGLVFTMKSCHGYVILGRKKYLLSQLLPNSCSHGLVNLYIFQREVAGLGE